MSYVYQFLKRPVWRKISEDMYFSNKFRKIKADKGTLVKWSHHYKHQHHHAMETADLAKSLCCHHHSHHWSISFIVIISIKQSQQQVNITLDAFCDMMAGSSCIVCICIVISVFVFVLFFFVFVFVFECCITRDAFGDLMVGSSCNWSIIACSLPQSNFDWVSEDQDFQFSFVSTNWKSSTLHFF